MKRQNPLHATLFTEIRQHRFLTIAWRRTVRLHVPYAPYLLRGRIGYFRLKPDIVLNGSIPPCPSTTTTHDCLLHCINRNGESYYVVNHLHSMITIGLPCGCKRLLGFNFHDALRNMRAEAINISDLSHTNPALCIPILFS